MEKQIEFLHFQHNDIVGAILETTPLIVSKKADAEVLSIVVVRDPYAYFDVMLADYLHQRKSLLFTDDILEQIMKKDADDFLRWLDGLNFLPFYNPQIYYLDARKRLEQAFDNLENFEYVVPYEMFNVFIGETKLPVTVTPHTLEPLPFSIRDVQDRILVEKFIGKDMVLYEKCQELWNRMEENGYKPLGDILHRMPHLIPLHEMEGFKGGCGGMNTKMLRGFAFSLEHSEPLEVAIYRNKELLLTTKADHSRPELQKKFGLPSDKCGILVNFEEDTFKPDDRVDVVILSKNIVLPILGQAKSFLDGVE